MSRIHDVFTDCAVYIYQSIDDAENGERFGGSGFLVHIPLEHNPEWSSLYVITNAHVVRRAKTPVIRLNRLEEGIECISTEANNWFFHPHGDDIAAFPLEVEFEKFRLWGLPPDYFLTSKIMFDEDIGIGDETVMVGRFINHEGRQQNSPAVRFGTIAMMAKEKIVTEEGLEQEAFLVEVRSLPGYSGSPVFIYSPNAINDMSERRFGHKKGEWPEGQDPSKKVEGGTTTTTARMPNFDYLRPKGPYLLGIDFCHINRRSPVRNRDGKKMSEGWYVEENTGMAGVIPSWKIRELLDDEVLLKMRAKEDAEVTKKKQSGASLDNSEDERSTEKALTQKEFEDTLRKVTRKKPSRA